MEGSFMSKFLYMNKKESWMEKRAERRVDVKKGAKWNSLPKHVWVFWGDGIANSSIAIQLCTRNIKDVAESSGFKYH